ncbi:hypothetical protein [Rhodoblastus sp.]|uniref:hypothetical protein n=1 Tax=Rhodoblastus sp. TaxID=1962975 RepID=UPI0035B1DEFA
MLGFVAASLAPACAAPANTLRELFVQLDGCMKVVGEPGEELTIAFSLKRDGALLGKPHIAFSKLPRDGAVRTDFLESVAGAFSRCLPAQITDALGGAVAGRRLTMRFVIRGRDFPS